MRVPEIALLAAAGIALAAGCGTSGRAPARPDHEGEGHLTEAPSPASEFEGFVHGGRRGLDEAKRSGRGAMLFFAATW